VGVKVTNKGVWGSKYILGVWWIVPHGYLKKPAIIEEEEKQEATHD
jgi:hypothetical protein